MPGGVGSSISRSLSRDQPTRHLRALSARVGMADLAGAPPGTRLCAHARRTAARARMSRSELEVLWDMPNVYCNPTAAAAVLRRSCPEPLQYSSISVPQPPQETGHFPFQNGRGTVQNHPAGVVGGAASGLDASAVAATRPEFRRRSCRFAHGC